MEKSRSGEGRVLLLCGLLATFLFFNCANAEGKIKKVKDPTANVNLSPFQQWRSAYECLLLLNESTSCTDEYTLTEKGWMDIADTQEYCKEGGCAQHTMAALTCIHLVKRDYKFADKATVQQVNNTIIQKCGFSGAT